MSVELRERATPRSARAAAAAEAAEAAEAPDGASHSVVVPPAGTAGHTAARANIGSGRRANPEQLERLAAQAEARQRRHVPWKAIGLAVFLFLLGSVLITVGVLVYIDYWEAPEYLDRANPLLFLGAIAFIPGAYHVHIAWRAWRGDRGYSYAQIPDID